MPTAVIVAASSGIASISSTYGTVHTMSSIVRGNQVSITVTFYAADKTKLTPASADLYLEWGGTRLPKATKVSMTSNPDGSWTGTWDSTMAGSGHVYWSARSTTPTAVIDGTFELTGNPANQPNCDLGSEGFPDASSWGNPAP